MKITVTSTIIIWLSLVAVELASAEIIECNIPTDFTIPEQFLQFLISEASLNVSINIDEMKINSYNDSRIIKVFAKDVEIHFSGNGIDISDDDSGILIQDMKAYAERELRELGVYVPKRWRVLLLPADNQPEVPTTNKNVIRRFAEGCLQEVLPQKITIKEEDLQDAPSIDDTCILPMPYRYSIVDSSLQAVQPLFNKFLDLMLEESKSRFLDDINGVIPLSYADLTNIVNEHVFIRLSIFFVHSGTIRDLRNLFRAGDASIAKTGDKYTFTGGFIIVLPTVTFQHITGIGGLRFYGDLNMTIQNVEFQLTASFDESVTPCLLTVDGINITRIGHVDFSMNGFRPLNGVAESAADAAVDGVKASVGDIIAHEIKDMGQRLLDTIDCEKLGIAHLRDTTIV